jgi:hypothetical protein
MSTIKLCTESARFRRDIQLTSDFDTLIGTRGVPREFTAVVFLHIDYSSHMRKTTVPEAQCTMPFFFDIRMPMRQLVRTLKIHTSRVHDYHRREFFSCHAWKDVKNSDAPTCCITTDVSRWFFVDKTSLFPLLPTKALLDSPIDTSNILIDVDLPQTPDGCLAAGLPSKKIASSKTHDCFENCKFEMPVLKCLSRTSEITFEKVTAENLDALCDLYRTCSHRQGMCSSVARQILTTYPRSTVEEKHKTGITNDEKHKCRCDLCRYDTHSVIARLAPECTAKFSDQCCCAFRTFVSGGCAHVLHFKAIIDPEDYFYDVIGDRIYGPAPKKKEEGILFSIPLSERIIIAADYAVIRSKTKKFIAPQKQDPLLTRPFQLLGLSYQQFLRYFQDKYSTPGVNSIVAILAPEMARYEQSATAAEECMTWAHPYACHFLANVLAYRSRVIEDLQVVLKAHEKLLAEDFEQLAFAELVREKNRRLAFGRICTGRMEGPHQIIKHDDCVIHIWAVAFMIFMLETEAPVIRAIEDQKIRLAEQKCLSLLVETTLCELPARPVDSKSPKRKQQHEKNKKKVDTKKNVHAPVPKRQLVVPRIPPSKIRPNEDYLRYTPVDEPKSLVFVVQVITPIVITIPTETKEVVTPVEGPRCLAIDNLCLAFEKAATRHADTSCSPTQSDLRFSHCLPWNLVCVL